MPIRKEITVQGIQCPRCNEQVWSRSGHDMRSCTCTYCFADGGRNYLRYGWGDRDGDGSVAEKWGKPTIVDIDVVVWERTPEEQEKYVLDIMSTVWKETLTNDTGISKGKLPKNRRGSPSKTPAGSKARSSTGAGKRKSEGRGTPNRRSQGSTK